jgi:toxin ParE1/3/4
VREIEFARASLRDIAEIGRESERVWGSAQRDKYLGEINRRIEQLADRPELGPVHDAERPGLRRLRVGSHIVFYRFDEVRLLVVRVLHQRMDLERHLGREGR